MNGKTNWHNIPWEKAAGLLDSNIEKGLSEREIESRRNNFGENKLPGEKPLSQLKIFLEQFQSPLIYILIIAGIEE